MIISRIEYWPNDPNILLAAWCIFRLICFQSNSITFFLLALFVLCVTLSTTKDKQILALNMIICISVLDGKPLKCIFCFALIFRHRNMYVISDTLTMKMTISKRQEAESEKSELRNHVYYMRNV